VRVYRKAAADETGPWPLGEYHRLRLQVAGAGEDIFKALEHVPPGLQRRQAAGFFCHFAVHGAEAMRVIVKAIECVPAQQWMRGAVLHLAGPALDELAVPPELRKVYLVAALLHRPDLARRVDRGDQLLWWTSYLANSGWPTRAADAGVDDATKEEMR
jgi:hypothetical protein